MERKPKFDWHPSPRRPRCPSSVSSSSAFSSRLPSFSSDAGDSFVSAADCFEEDERESSVYSKEAISGGYGGRAALQFVVPTSRYAWWRWRRKPRYHLPNAPGRSISETPLDWPTRRRIALGSARGLSYLHDHCGPKFLYNGINATNIFLDEEFEAVVGGYPTAVRGSIYHIAPEYLSTGRYSEKTDVFSYGIMLLELITGKRIFDLHRLAKVDDESLLDWMIGLLEEKRLDMLVDPELQDNYIEVEVEFTIQLAILCSQGSQMGRPKMSEVVRILEGEDLTERWEEWKKANECGLDLEFGTYRIWKSDSTENFDSMELSSPSLDLEFGTYRIWKSDSTENLDSMELSSPR